MSVNYNPASPTDGLVLCLDTGNRRSYPGSGNTWFDISGQNNHGTLTNGAALNTGFGGGISFDGVNDYALTAASMSFPFGTGDFTWSAWVYPRSFANYTHIICINGNQNNGALKISKNTEGNKLYYYDTTINTYPNGPTISINTWNHVIFLRRSSVIEFYKDGLFDSIKTGFSRSISSNYYLQFGYGFGAEYTNGNLEDIRVYGRALSPPEIYQLFSSKRGRFGV